MENKNNTYVIGVVFLAIGLLLGWIFFGVGETNSCKMGTNGQHMMPDGSMMAGMEHDSMSMDEMMHDMMAGLEGKTGDAFDKAFLTEMIVHHEGAVDMAEAVLATSEKPELRKLAEDIITAQTGEIAMMKGWLEEWY